MTTLALNQHSIPFANASEGAFTITLPPSANRGDNIQFIDSTSSFATIFMEDSFTWDLGQERNITIIPFFIREKCRP